MFHMILAYVLVGAAIFLMALGAISEWRRDGDEDDVYEGRYR